MALVAVLACSRFVMDVARSTPTREFSCVASWSLSLFRKVLLDCSCCKDLLPQGRPGLAIVNFDNRLLATAVTGEVECHVERPVRLLGTVGRGVRNGKFETV